MRIRLWILALALASGWAAPSFALVFKTGAELNLGTPLSPTIKTHVGKQSVSKKSALVSGDFYAAVPIIPFVPGINLSMKSFNVDWAQYTDLNAVGTRMNNKQKFTQGNIGLFWTLPIPLVDISFGPDYTITRISNSVSLLPPDPAYLASAQKINRTQTSKELRIHANAQFTIPFTPVFLRAYGFFPIFTTDAAKTTNLGAEVGWMFSTPSFLALPTLKVGPVLGVETAMLSIDYDRWISPIDAALQQALPTPPAVKSLQLKSVHYSRVYLGIRGDFDL